MQHDVSTAMEKNSFEVLSKQKSAILELNMINNFC